MFSFYLSIISAFLIFNCSWYSNSRYFFWYYSIWQIFSYNFYSFSYWVAFFNNSWPILLNYPANLFWLNGRSFFFVSANSSTVPSSDPYLLPSGVFSLFIVYLSCSKAKLRAFSWTLTCWAYYFWIFNSLTFSLSGSERVLFTPFIITFYFRLFWSEFLCLKNLPYISPIETSLSSS